MKVCPVCRARVFDDMDVCYGCLYRFGTDDGDARARPVGEVWSSSEFEPEPAGAAGMADLTRTASATGAADAAVAAGAMRAASSSQTPQAPQTPPKGGVWVELPAGVSSAQVTIRLGRTSPEKKAGGVSATCERTQDFTKGGV